ncbi:hypothetical protein NAEGRDRAFT_78672 [Naegleria gruberi]|uniref:PH domain-containing protein n=1 Tax=Naegleria gruberi TaxID=5762 RepID=D2V5L4_NAEGR|nr:uncharacterized protein NAEGRDRAFT_78672 [Naegleria gruberi]EFC47821.1 hypothetical protein NAEGRDRAFT_78672 [Naegleria gruberi]|eukprot:XP_002680565.1 hypothetical protein NAEGRDRAFT_78672 [Naegleria gruberi strain NEG-M]
MRHTLKIVTKTRTYYLAANSEQDANEWLIALIEQSGYHLVVKSAQDPTPLEKQHRNCQIFGSIQTAIDAARGGEKILIYPGIYRENLWIEKPIQLVGYMSELEIKQKTEAMKQILSKQYNEEGHDGEEEAVSVNAQKDLRKTASMDSNAMTNANDVTRMSESELRKTASSRRVKNTNAVAVGSEMKKKIEEERIKTKIMGSTNNIVIENADENESCLVYKANGGVISNITFRVRTHTYKYASEEEKPVVSCLELDNGGLTLKGVTISSSEYGSGIILMNKSILIMMESIISQCRDMGIWLMDRSQCTVTRSRIVSCKLDGIRVSGESSLHKLKEVDILGCGLSGLCICDRSLSTLISHCNFNQNISDNIRVQNEGRVKKIVSCSISNASEFGILFANYPARGFSQDDLLVKLTNNSIENNKMGDIYIEHLDYMGRFIKKYVRRKKKE